MSKKHEDQATPDPAVKPTIIDLDAEEVVTEAGAAPEPAPPTQESPATPARPRKLPYWMAFPLIGGLVAGGWLYRDVLSTYLPSQEMTGLADRIARLEIQDKATDARLATLDGSVQALTGDVSNIEGMARGAVDASKAAAGTQQAHAAATDQRLAAIDTAIAGLKSALAAAAAAGSSGGDPADAAVLAALAQRIETLEKDVASLKQGAGPGDTDTAALSQALSDLKAKAAAGLPFAPELDRIARMVPAAPGLDVLGRHAATGLANAGGLAEAMKALIPALPTPEITPGAGDGGYIDSVLDALGGLITIRKLGEADWRQIGEKCMALAEAGDLAQAVSLVDGTEGAKPSGLLQWRDKAAARLELDSALGAAAEAVLRVIAAKG